MEIVKKARISANGKSEEVEAVIDTGAERTMIDEEVLLKIGAPHLDNLPIEAAGQFKEVKPVYGASVEIDSVRFGVLITGGKKNLIGHDFLQLAKAIINEETGEVKLTKSWIEM